MLQLLSTSAEYPAALKSTRLTMGPEGGIPQEQRQPPPRTIVTIASPSPSPSSPGSAFPVDDDNDDDDDVFQAGDVTRSHSERPEPAERLRSTGSEVFDELFTQARIRHESDTGVSGLNPVQGLQVDQVNYEWQVHAIYFVICSMFSLSLSSSCLCDLLLDIKASMFVFVFCSDGQRSK